MKQIQEIHFNTYDSEWAERLERLGTPPFCGKTGAESMHGSCTELLANKVNHRDLFLQDEYYTWLQEWGINPVMDYMPFLYVPPLLDGRR